MVPAPDATGFTFLNILYTGIGSAVFWGKAGRSKLRAYALSDLVTRLRVPAKWRGLTEFALFVTLGCIVGIGLVDPRNAVQGLTAGFAWTAAFTTPDIPGKAAIGRR